MKLEEFEKYFDLLEEIQMTIGYEKKNKEKLIRLENLKELILDVYIDGMVSQDFSYKNSYKDGFEEMEIWMTSKETIKRAYLRTDLTKCKVPGRPWIISRDLFGDDPPRDVNTGILLRQLIPLENQGTGNADVLQSLAFPVQEASRKLA